MSQQVLLKNGIYEIEVELIAFCAGKRAVGNLWCGTKTVTQSDAL